MIFEITDFNAPELDIYARKTENQLLNREFPEQGIFIAESPKVVLRALDAGYEPISFLVEKKHVFGEAAELLSRCPEIPVYTAEYDVLTQLTGYALTRGVLCAMHRKPLPSAEALCATARRVVVLENIMNPTNVGAIIRSAAALNMDSVLLTPHCSNPLYRRAIRVSMGTVFQIPWAFLPETASGTADMELLNKMAFKSAAMALCPSSVSIEDPVLQKELRLAIILGSEEAGLSQETIERCDYKLRIPMSHGVDSLNVSAASAIAFWQLGK